MLLFESFNEIESICQKYNIKNYTINPDGTIDVDGYVYLSWKYLKKLPLKFRKVTGNFYCFDNELTTLEGAPQSVGGYFSCNGNQLTTLEGAPKSVKGNFYCSSNQLTTLKGAPESIFDKIKADNNPIAIESYFGSYLEILKRIKHGEKITNALITPSLLAFLKEKHSEVYEKVISSTDEESTKIKDILGDFGFD